MQVPRLERPERYGWQRFHRVSRNGLWVVGNTAGQTDPPPQAVRWSEAGGFESIGRPSPGASTGGEAIADDGTFAGVAGTEAFLWTPAGFEMLGDLPGGSFSSQARGILRDGTLIVGSGTSAAGLEAALWGENRTLHRVADVLATHGVAVPSGWILRQAWDVVKIGRVITLCGWGTNPSGDSEAWITRYKVLPPHSTEPTPTRTVVNSIPLTVLPPVPRVGGTIRLAAETSTEEIAFVVIESEGKRVVLARGAMILTEDGRSVTEIKLPDDASLARRTLQLRAGLRDRMTGTLRWSDESSWSCSRIRCSNAESRRVGNRRPSARASRGPAGAFDSHQGLLLSTAT